MSTSRPQPMTERHLGVSSFAGRERRVGDEDLRVAAVRRREVGHHGRVEYVLRRGRWRRGHHAQFDIEPETNWPNGFPRVVGVTLLVLGGNLAVPEDTRPDVVVDHRVERTRIAVEALEPIHCRMSLRFDRDIAAGNRRSIRRLELAVDEHFTQGGRASSA